MIVLDTNIISEIMRPTPTPLVLAWLAQQPVASLAVTAITVAEIRYGIRRLADGKRRNELARRFQLFMELGFGERIISVRRSGGGCLRRCDDRPPAHWPPHRSV